MPPIIRHLFSWQKAYILGAALEAFLATSFGGAIMPYRSELHIIIRGTDFLGWSSGIHYQQKWTG